MTKHFGAAANPLCSTHPHAFRALQGVKCTQSSGKTALAIPFSVA